MITKSLLVAVLATAISGATVSAHARHDVLTAAPQVVNLRDGSTLYVFKDGKMAKEDKLGRVVLLGNGEVLDAIDGRKLTAVGNEAARLDMLLNGGHRQ